MRTQARLDGRLYGIGGDVYRSDDAGVSWMNLTSYKGACLLGPGLRAVTVSPADPDDVVVASDTRRLAIAGWRVSWIGLNQFLPNLPGVHLLGLPSGTRGVRLELAGGSQGRRRGGMGAGREVGLEAVDARRRAA